MTNLFLFLLLLMTNTFAWSYDSYPGLQVDVKRDGQLYNFTASFDSQLTQCAAYHYLTDYEAAKNLPGVIESIAYRESSNTVRVERTAVENVLFFHVQLHSVMEYTEKPFQGITFTQLTGDSKAFQGNWIIESNPHGSTLRFQGIWEPDTVIPLFIIDHFAKNGLIERFSAIAQLGQKRKSQLLKSCETPQIATLNQ